MMESRVKGNGAKKMAIDIEALKKQTIEAFKNDPDTLKKTLADIDQLSSLVEEQNKLSSRWNFDEKKNIDQSVVKVKNIKIKEIIFIITIVLVMGLCLYGMTHSSGFIASDKWETFCQYFLIAIAVLISIPVLQNMRESPKFKDFGIVRRLFSDALIIGVIYMGTFVGITYGFGTLVNKFYGEDSIENLHVVHKSDGSYKRRACDYTVTLQRDNKITKELCLSEDTWSTFSVDDDLIGEMKTTRLGILINHLSKPKE